MTIRGEDIYVYTSFHWMPRLFGDELEKIKLIFNI